MNIFKFHIFFFTLQPIIYIKIMARIICIIWGLITLIVLLGNEYWLFSCPLYQLTGWECPFCGGQRMVHALLHADVMAAFHFNPFLFLCSPFLLIWGIYLLFPSLFPSCCSRLFNDRTFFLFLFAFLLWGIVRNTYICN